MYSHNIRSLQEAYLKVVENQQLDEGKMPLDKERRTRIGRQIGKRIHSAEYDYEGSKTGFMTKGIRDKLRQSAAKKVGEVGKMMGALKSAQKEEFESSIDEERLGDQIYKAGKKNRERTKSRPRKPTSNRLGAQIYAQRTDHDFMDGVRAAERRAGYRKLKEEQVDLYDIIFSHLLDEGYAETPEAAKVIMVNMSEEWRESIVEETFGEAYVPLRTSDEKYDKKGFPTTTSSWDRKLTDARLKVGSEKSVARSGTSDPTKTLSKGVAASGKLQAMKKVDEKPESQRRKEGEAKAAANKELGSKRRALQTSFDRQHLEKSFNR